MKHTLWSINLSDPCSNSQYTALNWLSLECHLVFYQCKYTQAACDQVFPLCIVRDMIRNKYETEMSLRQCSCLNQQHYAKAVTLFIQALNATYCNHAFQNETTVCRCGASKLCCYIKLTQAFPINVQVALTCTDSQSQLDLVFFASCHSSGVSLWCHSSSIPILEGAKFHNNLTGKVLMVIVQDLCSAGAEAIPFMLPLASSNTSMCSKGLCVLCQCSSITQEARHCSHKGYCEQLFLLRLHSRAFLLSFFFCCLFKCARVQSKLAKVHTTYVFHYWLYILC